MGSLILEIGMVAAFGLGNTPWQKKDTQFPYLLVEKNFYENFYISALNSSRVNIKNANTWDPKTALWKVEAGYKKDGLTIGVGHQSEHETGIWDSRTESYDFVVVRYRLEYP